MAIGILHFKIIHLGVDKNKSKKKIENNKITEELKISNPVLPFREYLAEKWVKVDCQNRLNKCVYVETMKWMMLLLFLLLEFLPDFIYGCMPRYQEELQYLDYYLGIEPENQGHLKLKGIFLL